MTPPRHAPSFAVLALRWTLACAAALVVARWGSEPLLRAALPALRPVLQAAAPDFHIADLALLRDRGLLVLGVAAQQARTVVVDGRAHVPDDDAPPLIAMAAAGAALQPLLAAMVLLAAWPCARWREWPWRLVLGLPLAAAASALDAPLALAASLWAGLLQDAGAAATPVALWGSFLAGGGRLLLGGVAGALAVALARRFSGGAAPAPPTRPAPAP